MTKETFIFQHENHYNFTKNIVENNICWECYNKLNTRNKKYEIYGLMIDFFSIIYWILKILKNCNVLLTLNIKIILITEFNSNSIYNMFSAYYLILNYHTIKNYWVCK